MKRSITIATWDYDRVRAIIDGRVTVDGCDVNYFALAPEEFIASGDTVAVVVRYTGTGKDTGKELDLPVVHVWDVRNGTLAQFRQFMDTAKFREVVGTA